MSDSEDPIVVDLNDEGDESSHEGEEGDESNHEGYDSLDDKDEGTHVVHSGDKSEGVNLTDGNDDVASVNVHVPDEVKTPPEENKHDTHEYDDESKPNEANTKAELSQEKKSKNSKRSAWNGYELDWLLCIDRAATESGISDATLCNIQLVPKEPINNTAIPMHGMVKTKGDKFVIQTNENESREIVFGDLVYDKDKNFMFSVLWSKQIAPHIYNVEIANQTKNISESQEVLIVPFSLTPIPSACRQSKRADIFESWILGGRETRSNILKLRKQALNQSAAIPPAQELGDRRKFVSELAQMFRSLDPQQNNHCPYPLVDGRCIDISQSKQATVESDIRPFVDFQLEIKGLAQAIRARSGEDAARQLCKNFSLAKDDYEKLMMRNTVMWQTMHEKNASLKTTMHTLLKSLVRAYGTWILRKETKNKSEETAKLWIAFYAAMPIFFFAATTDLLRYIRLTPSEFALEVPPFLHKFQKKLKEDLDIFLPRNSEFQNQSMLASIRNMVDSFKHDISAFQFLPPLQIQ